MSRWPTCGTVSAAQTLFYQLGPPRLESTGNFDQARHAGPFASLGIDSHHHNNRATQVHHSPQRESVQPHLGVTRVSQPTANARSNRPSVQSRRGHAPTDFRAVEPQYKANQQPSITPLVESFNSAQGINPQQLHPAVNGDINQLPGVNHGKGPHLQSNHVEAQPLVPYQRWIQHEDSPNANSRDNVMSVVSSGDPAFHQLGPRGPMGDSWFEAPGHGTRGEMDRIPDNSTLTGVTMSNGAYSQATEVQVPWEIPNLAPDLFTGVSDDSGTPGSSVIEQTPTSLADPPMESITEANVQPANSSFSIRRSERPNKTLRNEKKARDKLKQAFEQLIKFFSDPARKLKLLPAKPVKLTRVETIEYAQQYIRNLEDENLRMHEEMVKLRSDYEKLTSKFNEFQRIDMLQEGNPVVYAAADDDANPGQDMDVNMGTNNDTTALPNEVA